MKSFYYDFSLCIEMAVALKWKNLLVSDKYFYHLDESQYSRSTAKVSWRDKATYH